MISCRHTFLRFIVSSCRPSHAVEYYGVCENVRSEKLVVIIFITSAVLSQEWDGLRLRDEPMKGRARKIFYVFHDVKKVKVSSL